MGSVVSDMSQWPIVIHRSEGTMGPQETELFISRLDQVLMRKERYVTIFDSTKLSTSKMGDRDKILGWLRNNDANLRKYSVGTGVVLESAALRFVISSVLLIYSPPSPIKVFPNLSSALAWARAQLQLDGQRAKLQRA